jgi:hypothetical protein
MIIETEAEMERLPLRPQGMLLPVPQANGWADQTADNGRRKGRCMAPIGALSHEQPAAGSSEASFASVSPTTEPIIGGRVE